MEMQEIEVQINQDGKVEISVRGVKGLKCLEITADLEEALGGEVLLREMNPPAESDGPTELDQSNESTLSH